MYILNFIIGNCIIVKRTLYLHVLSPSYECKTQYGCVQPNQFYSFSFNGIVYFLLIIKLKGNNIVRCNSYDFIDILILK